MINDFMVFEDATKGPFLACRISKIIWLRRYQTGIEVGYDGNLRGYMPCDSDETSQRMMRSLCNALAAMNRDTQNIRLPLWKTCLRWLKSSFGCLLSRVQKTAQS